MYTTKDSMWRRILKIFAKALQGQAKWVANQQPRIDCSL